MTDDNQDQDDGPVIPDESEPDTESEADAKPKRESLYPKRDKRKLFMETFRASMGNITLACKAANVDRSTFYQWCRKDKRFRDRCDDVANSLIDYTESKLMMNIKAGKEQSIFFLLKTKGKSRGYVERSEVAVASVDANQFEAASDEDVALLLRERGWKIEPPPSAPALASGSEPDTIQDATILKEDKKPCP